MGSLPGPNSTHCNAQTSWVHQRRQRERPSSQKTPKKTPKHPTMSPPQQHFFTISPCFRDHLMLPSHLPPREVQSHPKIQISDGFGASRALLRQWQGVRLCDGLGSWEAICSPRVLPPPHPPHRPRPVLTPFTRCASFNCNPRTGRAERTQRSIQNPTAGQTDSELQADGAAHLGKTAARWLLPTGERVPRSRNRRPCWPGCSETPLRLGRSYEAGGGAALGISPLHLRLLLCGPAAGTEVVEGRLGQGMPPHMRSAGMWE